MASITATSSTFFPIAFGREMLNIDSFSLRVSGIYHPTVRGELHTVIRTVLSFDYHNTCS